MREEYWQRRHLAAEDEEERLYWEERRRYEEDYMEWCRRGNLGPFPRRPPFAGGAPPPVSTCYNNLVLEYKLVIDLKIRVVMINYSSPLKIW